MVWRYDTLLLEVFFLGQVSYETREEASRTWIAHWWGHSPQREETVLNLLPKLTYTEALETERLEFPSPSHYWAYFPPDTMSWACTTQHIHSSKQHRKGNKLPFKKLISFGLMTTWNRKFLSSREDTFTYWGATVRAVFWESTLRFPGLRRECDLGLVMEITSLAKE